MKLVDIAHAYMELDKLAAEKLPLKISWGIDKILKQLDRPFNFYAAKELEILQKYEPAEQNGSLVRFKDRETTEAYNLEHAELDEIEEEIQIKPVRIDIDTDIHISRESLKILAENGMIEIVEKEEREEKDHGCSCCG